MPPAMTSAHGSVRSSSTSGLMMPRREPLRRLYPLQRARTVSDSIRESGGFGTNENALATVVVDTDNGTLLSVSQKRRGVQRLNSSPAVTVPQYKLSLSQQQQQQQQRYPSGSPERTILYSRPPLVRRSSDVSYVNSYSSSSSCPVNGAADFSSEISRQGSILKRPISQQQQHSSQQQRRTRGRDSALTTRQVKFCPNVSVVKMDEDGEHLGTHFQELNGEKRTLTMSTLSLRQPSRNHDNRSYDNVVYLTDDGGSLLQQQQQQDKSASHDLQRRSSVDQQQTTSSGVQSSSERLENVRFQELFKRLNNNNGGSFQSGSFRGEENVPLKKGQFNITFSNRVGEPTKLHFVLHMGHDYNPNDLIVKANTTGRRIRVLATRMDRSSRQAEEFNEKYMLPMDIDPYEIEAKLDKWGNLTVEAPLMTVDKRAEVSKSINNVLCAIYV